MKYYGLNKGKNTAMLRWHIERSKACVLQYCSGSRSKRDFYKHINTYYLSRSRETKNLEGSIPHGKVCKPIGLITSDLILREDLSSLKDGLEKLIRSFYTHKIRGTMHATEEILADLDKMDNLNKWSYSSICAGSFDFERHKNLQKIISNFFLNIKQINSSYLAVEARIFFSEEYSHTLQDIINSDLDKQEVLLTPVLYWNKKKSGAKTGVTYSTTHSISHKGDAIYEKMIEVKWHFFTFLNRYFPTLLHRLDVAPPSVLFFETNIDYRETSNLPFWRSIGLSTWCGQFIDDAQKLFFEIGTGIFSDHDKADNMVYIFHNEKIELQGGFQNVDDQVMHHYEEKYSTAIFMYQFLETLNRVFTEKLKNYNVKCNKIKLKRRQLYRMLKLRYNLEKDVDAYRRYINDEIWAQAEATIADLFGKKKTIHHADYGYITRYPLAVKNRLMEKIVHLEKEFDEKTYLLQHLASYKQERKNQWVNYVMLGISAITLWLLIYPNHAKEISEFINTVVGVSPD